MGQHKPELQSVEDVMSFYELQSCCPFEITVGIASKGEVCHNWLETDNPVGGKEALENFLRHIANNVNNVNIYTLICFNTRDIIRDPDFKRKKDWESKSIRFQLNLPKPMMYYNEYNQPQPPKTVSGVQIERVEKEPPHVADYIKSEVERLRSTIYELEQENRKLRNDNHDLQLELLQANNTIDQLENEDPKETASEKIIGSIGGILSNPDVQMAIPVMLNGLIDRIFPPKPAQPIPPKQATQVRPKPAINGTKKKKSGNGGSANSINNS
jgi:hypothetical protein